ncbi:MAG: hypothetical protein WAN50_05265 [Minisyncoccia bacterium]
MSKIESTKTRTFFVPPWILLLQSNQDWWKRDLSGVRATTQEYCIAPGVRFLGTIRLDIHLLFGTVKVTASSPFGVDNSSELFDRAWSHLFPQV